MFVNIYIYTSPVNTLVSRCPKTAATCSSAASTSASLDMPRRPLRNLSSFVIPLKDGKIFNGGYRKPLEKFGISWRFHGDFWWLEEWCYDKFMGFYGDVLGFFMWISWKISSTNCDIRWPSGDITGGDLEPREPWGITMDRLEPWYSLGDINVEHTWKIFSMGYTDILSKNIGFFDWNDLGKNLWEASVVPIK